MLESKLRSHREGNGEEAGGVLKRERGCKVRACQQREHNFRGELVAVFGMDGLALGEMNGMTVQVDRLRAVAFEVHLDARVRSVPAHAMQKASGIEVCAQLAVQVGEHVAVEGRCDSGGIVIRREQRGYRF